MNLLLRLLGLDGGTDVQSVSTWTWRAIEPASAAVTAVIVVGAILALINFLPRLRVRKTVRLWSFLLRLGMTGVLVVLMLHLEVQLKMQVRQKPAWVVLVDDSGSMATADAPNGATRFAAATSDLAAIRQAAGAQVQLDVQTLSGQALGEQAGKGPTLIAQAVTRGVLGRSGVDRLIFLTDGHDSEKRDLTNLGGDLKSRGVALGVRVYGQETPPAEPAIFAQPQRPMIRLGEDLVVKGSIAKAAKSEGASYTVSLKENGKQVKQVAVSPQEAGGFLVSYKPPKSGTFLYTLQLEGMGPSALGNAYSFKANVVEEKIKILVLEGFPGYEFKLMKVALEVDPMVQLASVVQIPGGGVYVQGKPLHKNPEQGLVSSQSELFKYDIIFLMNLSRQYFRAGGDTSESRLRDIVEFVNKRGGGLVVLGGSDVYRAGGYESSPLADLLPFDQGDFFSKDAQFDGKFFVTLPKAAYSHPILRMFDDPKRNKERLDGLRQLDGSNNVGRFKPLATPLLTRGVKIKDARGELVEKEVPILAYQAVGDGKVVAAAVDTLWRWQLQPEFEDPPLAKMLANIVRFIAPPPRMTPGGPDVKISDQSLQVGQQATLYTTLKDKNYDPIRNADLKVTVTRPDGSKQDMYPRDLGEQPGRYEYKIDLDAPGAYDVKAALDKEEYNTSFVVEASGSELADRSADLPAMQSLAKAAGGEVISSMDSWLASAAKMGSIQPAVRDLQVWNSPLALLAFLVMLSADCYIRKRQGLP